MSWLVYGALAYLVYRAVNETGEAAKNKKTPKAKRVGSKRRPPHEVLEVEPDASADEVRRAYQDKIRVYHPDKVAGAADELKDLAEARSKEINAAYEAMMRSIEAREG